MTKHAKKSSFEIKTMGDEEHGMPGIGTESVS